jgi:hypothetical protein
MKYVKTFENFSQEMNSEMAQREQELDINSPEYKKMLLKIADEKGIDDVEVLKIHDEIKDLPVETNEEVGPIALLLVIPMCVTLLLTSMGLNALTARKGLKIYIDDLAKQKVTELIKKDPNLADNYENLVSKAYDEMMNDKEFIAKVKKEQGEGLFVRGQQRYKGSGGVTFGTAGRF